MTIIQAQSLKQFGISGPASALDNEVPVFDGVTGKKIKAATGITSPSSGRLDLAEIDVDEIGNSAGDLKLQADVQGDVVLFGDTDVGDVIDGKKIIVHRKAAEGDDYMRMGISQFRVAEFYSNRSLKFSSANSIQFFPEGGILSFGRNYGGVNDVSRFNGYLTAITDDRYAQFQVNDATDNFELTRQDSNIGYFDIQMPTIITGGLDIDSDIIRLRTAKTPASAGAAGNQGDECWDANYCYRCVATNTWKRTALTTW